MNQIKLTKNQLNTILDKNNTTGVKGSWWSEKRNKWEVKIKVGGKNINLGRYSTIQGAWLARKWGERLYFR